MPRYYFVLSSKDGFIDDIEGTELPDLAAARRNWAGWAMQAQDGGGAVLFVAPFSRSARARRRAQGI